MAEEEWVQEPAGPSAALPTDPRAQAILDGFKINWMNMSDATTGRVLWQEEDWGDLMVQRDIHLPKAILQCRSVSREFQFSCKEMLHGLRLEQKIFFQGGCMEEWNFQFGFVIPNSTNTWQQTIHAAEENKMLPASLLNGNVLIETASQLVEAPPWQVVLPGQRPSSRPVPPQGAPGGSRQLGTPRVRPSHWASSHGPGGSSEPPPKSLFSKRLKASNCL